MTEPAEILLRSHEERLQKLDDALTANTRETVACRGQVDSLTGRLDDHTAHLMERITAGFDRLNEKMESHASATDSLRSKVDEIGKQVGLHEADIKKFKVEDKALAARSKKLKAAGFGLLLTGAGAFFKHVGDQVWKVVHH